MSVIGFSPSLRRPQRPVVQLFMHDGSIRLVQIEQDGCTPTLICAQEAGQRVLIERTTIRSSAVSFPALREAA